MMIDRVASTPGFCHLITPAVDRDAHIPTQHESVRLNPFSHTPTQQLLTGSVLAWAKVQRAAYLKEAHELEGAMEALEAAIDVSPLIKYVYMYADVCGGAVGVGVVLVEGAMEHGGAGGRD